MFGPDESSHIARVWSISEGVVLSRDLVQPGAGPDTIPFPRWPGERDESDRLRAPGAAFPQIADPVRIDALDAAPLLSSPTPTAAIFSGARTYTPVAYLPHLVGMEVAKALDLSVGTTIDLMRLLGLVAYVVLVGAAIVVLRGYRARWLVFVAGLRVHEPLPSRHRQR